MNKKGGTRKEKRNLSVCGCCVYTGSAANAAEYFVGKTTYASFSDVYQVGEVDYVKNCNIVFEQRTQGAVQGR